MVKAIHYETQEETYQGQRCLTGKDRVRDTTCKTDMHGYCEKFSNIFPFPDKKQHCYKVEKEEEVEEDEEKGDNDDDPGAIRDYLDAELAKDPGKPVAKFPSRFASRSPRIRDFKFPEKPANKFPRKRRKS